MIEISKIYYPPTKDVIDFIKNYNPKFDGKLSNYFNFSRVVALFDFHRLVTKMNLIDHKNVSVISGSDEEPELEFLGYKNLEILNYDNKTGSFDLDQDWQNTENHEFIDLVINKKNKYDFVFCNQVLEHVFSPIQAIKNLHYITKKKGYIWISIPTINCIHGDPYFYSSGYHPRYLDRLGKEAGLEVIHVGAFGSRKYLAHAVDGHWCFHDELRPGFKTKRDFAYPYFAIQDGRKNNTNGKFIVDTWALFKKS